jgi:hypothetical protein
MEAFRRDFEIFWAPVRERIIKEGYMEKRHIAMLELFLWREWLKRHDHKTNNQ